MLTQYGEVPHEMVCKSKSFTNPAFQMPFGSRGQFGHMLGLSLTGLSEILGPAVWSALSDLRDLSDTGQSWLFKLDCYSVMQQTYDASPKAAGYWEKVQ